MVTIDAARIIGMADEIGSIETGKRADVILVDLKKAPTWCLCSGWSLAGWPSRHRAMYGLK